MINSDYKYTAIYEKIEDFDPIKKSTYIYGYSPEGRSHFADELVKKFSLDMNFVELELLETEQDSVKDNNTCLTYSLRSTADINRLLDAYASATAYIDVTGLNNRIAAPLLNHSLQKFKVVYVVYAEPERYEVSKFKAEGQFNDLAEEIHGIEPLPGFANIIPDEDDIRFIPLLGFEGGRFTHILEVVQPPAEHIYPIIGVPGYRAEYPFVAYWGNRLSLDNADTWPNIKYAAANSIVDIYMILSKILDKSPNAKIKVAPIGTKPHVIGAILFAIKHSRQVEIVYDNPIRKKKRTSGVGLIVNCCVSRLLNDN
jgi:hypothetical protein